MSDRFRIRWPLLSVLLAGLLASAAQAQERVKLAVEMRNAVLAEGRDSKAYLMVKLEGLPYEEAVSRPPVNVSLVIDRSGSMTGRKIEQAKEAAILALSRLSRGDRVSVVAFDHRVEVPVPAGPFENFDEMKRRIDAIAPGGQTAIYAAVRQAGQSVSEGVDPERINRVILMSDGQANVGPSSPGDLEALGRELGGHGVAVTTIGLGLDYSEELMTRLALASDGNHAFVENPEQLADIFNKEFGDAFSVVGRDVDIDIVCPEGVKPMRGLGRDVKVQGQRVSFRLNQIGGKQERYLLIELDVSKAKARGDAALADVDVSYLDPKTKARAKLAGQAQVNFSASDDAVSKSASARVAAAVATQLANERSEKAVLTRDAGNVADAKKQLEQNAATLRAEADRLQASAPAAAAPLRELSAKAEADAKALSSENWDKQRKSMRADQYRSKTQQNY
jgi:Ca-activated chloride channel homolog